MHHEPVMLNEVLELIDSHINTSSNINILDGTLGLGGYSEAVLLRYPNSFVFGIDRDAQAVSFSRERLKDYESSGRFRASITNFSRISEYIDRHYDVFMFDLGVSNMQITLPERGFSFQNDGPLDMRMNPDDYNCPPASEVLRTSDEHTLAKIFYDYGEERYSRQIASAIKNHKATILTTSDLVNLIRDTLPKPVQRKMGTHPARRVFQALRIYVNNETGELEELLSSLPKLKHDSKISLVIFVSYHSIEDRMIKHKFRELQAEGSGKILTRHPLTPSPEELERNYKARSAKLRAFCLT